MKLSAIGEFGFIHRIAPPFLKDLPDSIVGIGDDCAVIPWQNDALLLVTTDMLIEDVHFIRSKIPPSDLGYKSLAVNLSDIAAMGGTPTSAYISIGIPEDIEVEWLDKFYAGLHELAESSKVHLLGGDTTKSPNHLVINIAVLGSVKSENVKYRSSAKEGDIICVTDFIGDSGGGLRILLENCEMDADAKELVYRHHRPRPHLEEGIWLAKQNGVRAMMDVSDGIDSDLHRIMERSNCGAEIQVENLPVSPLLKRVSEKYNWDAFEIAATGGEDYCLLVTIAPESFFQVASQFEIEFGRELFNIGKITKPESGLSYVKNGQQIKFGKPGFNHFSE